MAAPRKITNEQISIARQIVEMRRKALRQARLHPTLGKLAAQLGCSPRYLQKLIARSARG